MTIPNATQARWLIEWKHNWGYRALDIWESADSAEEGRAAIEGILASDIWTPEGAEELGGEETEPAYGALVREEFDGDIVSGLIGLRYGGIRFACDEGTLRIERER
jgi:hypothetical protein